jgi:hypothetical protein
LMHAPGGDHHLAHEDEHAERERGHRGDEQNRGAKRPSSAVISPAIAVSRNTGAIASWIAWVMLDRWDSSSGMRRP